MTTTLPLHTVAYRSESEVHTEPLDQNKVELIRKAFFWEKKGRTLSQQDHTTCKQAIKSTVLDAFQYLDVALQNGGSKLQLDVTAAIWLNRLDDVGLEYCEAKTEDPSSEIDTEIAQLTLPPRPSHCPAHHIEELAKKTIHEVSTS